VVVGGRQGRQVGGRLADTVGGLVGCGVGRWELQVDCGKWQVDGQVVGGSGAHLPMSACAYMLCLSVQRGVSLRVSMCKCEPACACVSGLSGLAWHSMAWHIGSLRVDTFTN